MATSTTRRTTTKKPSQAEVARRASQSKQDKGTGPIKLTVKDVDLEIDPDLLDDYDALAAADGGNFRPMLALMIPDDSAREKALNTLRVDGKLKYSAVVEFVNDVFEEISAKN